MADVEFILFAIDLLFVIINIPATHSQGTYGIYNAKGTATPNVSNDHPKPYLTFE